MKKLLFLSAAMFVSASAFAVLPSKFDTPEKVAARKAKYAKECENYKGNNIALAHLNTEMKLLETDVSSFADMCKVADQVYASFGIPDNPKNTNYENLILPLCWFGYPNSFIKEGYTFYKSKNDLYAMSCVLKNLGYEKCGLTAKEAVSDYETIIDSKWFSATNDAQRIDLVISGYLDATRKAGTDDAQVKATLKKLNRMFTEKLLTDKAKWEPIVAKIRSILETY